MDRATREMSRAISDAQDALEDGRRAWLGDEEYLDVDLLSDVGVRLQYLASEFFSFAGRLAGRADMVLEDDETLPPRVRITPVDHDPFDNDETAHGEGSSN